MDSKNKLYKNQGAHVIVSLFTVVDNTFKVLMIQRKNEPFEGYWCLLGGAVYNNETLEHAIQRELKEKSGIQGVKPELHGVFSNPERARETGFRMLGLGYLAVVDSSAINVVKESEKASSIKWWDISKIPSLAYDHREILDSAIEYLRESIFKSSMIKVLFPNYVTIPELQNAFESITNKKYDRRNFRKKLLSIGLIEDTGKISTEYGKKPSKLYKIIDIKSNIVL